MPSLGITNTLVQSFGTLRRSLASCPSSLADLRLKTSFDGMLHRAPVGSLESCHPLAEYDLPDWLLKCNPRIDTSIDPA